MSVYRFACDNLRVEIHESRQQAGASAGACFAGELKRLLARDGKAGVVLASAVSQNEFLAALRDDPEIDWGRVAAFHLDEYAGMPADHPASFSRFLKERLFDHVPIGCFHPLRGETSDLEGECARYAGLLASARPSLAALGIGENGHVAFINPPTCDFNDPRDVRVAELDEVCRIQYVHEGAFRRLGDVPALALTLTVPFLMRVPRAVVTVLGPSKRDAVKAALEGPVSPDCPGSILRRHPGATLFLDLEAAALLEQGLAASRG